MPRGASLFRTLLGLTKEEFAIPRFLRPAPRTLSRCRRRRSMRWSEPRQLNRSNRRGLLLREQFDRPHAARTS